MPTPAAAPTSDGIASVSPLAGLVTAAVAPTKPNTRMATTPTRGRRSATIPRTTAAITRSVSIPVTSANLSFEPNVRMAKLFNHSGVASIAALPTARIGDEDPPITPAASWATPIATAPLSSPIVPPTMLPGVDGEPGSAIGRSLVVVARAIPDRV